MVVKGLNNWQCNGGPPVAHHLMLLVASGDHHTDVQLIAGGPLATLFAGGGPPVVHQWPSVANPTLQLPTACHWLSTSGVFGTHSQLWTKGVMLSGKVFAIRSLTWDEVPSATLATTRPEDSRTVF